MQNGKYDKLFISGFQSQTSAFYQLSAHQKVGVFGVYFQPYAVPLLFDIPAPEITNHNLEITELLGKEGTLLEEQILNCENVHQRVAVRLRRREDYPTSSYLKI